MQGVLIKIKFIFGHYFKNNSIFDLKKYELHTNLRKSQEVKSNLFKSVTVQKKSCYFVGYNWH